MSKNRIWLQKDINLNHTLTANINFFKQPENSLQIYCDDFFDYSLIN